MMQHKSAGRVALLVIGLCAGITAVAAKTDFSLKGGLQAKDESTGERLLVMARGDEYTLQISTTDEFESGELTVDGLDGDAFEVGRGGSGVNAFIVNGKKTTTWTHTFAVRPLKGGLHTLGPVRAGSKTVSPQTVLVRVLEPEAYDSFAGKKGSARQALKCSLRASVQEAYVGQPITVTITLQDDGRVLERGLQPPQFSGLKAEALGQARSDQKVINGALRVVTEQDYQITADQSGSYTIEPAVAHFVVPDEDAGSVHMQGMFGSFFGPQGKKRSVASNALALVVRPLPPSTMPVDGVGVFESFVAQAAKTIVEVNEPVTVTYVLQGRGNFDAITAPELQVPEELTVYPSTARFTPSPGLTGKGMRIFEYVLQVSQPGACELPAQTFHYFDTAQACYKTLTAHPLTFTCKVPKGAMPGAAPLPEAFEEQAPAQKTAVAAEPVGYQVPVIPWWYLIMAGLTVLLVVLRHFAYVGLQALLRVVGILSEARQERAALEALLRGQDAAGLYPFFLQALARAWGCRPEELDSQGIAEKSVPFGWDLQHQEHFAAYLDRCSQAAFAPTTLNAAEKTALFDRALYWYELVLAQKERK